ncbi:putative regulator of K+ conductance, NAD(P)-binding domain superfamily [Helianthus anomalus]
MNISSSFKIRGYQSVNCGTFEQLNLQSSFGYSFLSNPRSVSNICSRKKLIASSNHGFNSTKIQERFNSVCILKIRGTFKTACQGNDSVPFINGNGRDVESGDTKNAESSKEETKSDSKEKGEEAEAVAVAPTLDELKELLQKAHKELEIAQLNSIMFEDKAQRISEAAIALKDKALNAWDDVNSALISIEEIVKEEGPVKEAIKRAKMALSLAEARHQVALESENENLNSLEEEKALLAAQKDMKECSAKLEDCEKALIRLQNRKDEVQKEVVTLNDVAEKAQTDALKAEEDVANIMLLAEEAVALELEALKRVNDAEIALQKAEKVLVISLADTSKSTVSDEETLSDENALDVNSDEVIADKDSDAAIEDPLSGPVQDNGSSFVGQVSEESRFSDDSDKGNEQTVKDTESDIEKTKNVVQTKKQETQKDFTKDSSPSSSPKALLMKSSRFLPASFFSLEGDGTEFTPAAVFQELGESVKKNLPKLLISSLLVGASFAFYAKREERIGKIFQQPNIITTNLDEVSSNAQPLVRQIKKLPEKVKKIIEMLPHQEIIAQLLSERLIPFVALDVNSDRVSVGRALDLPVYFGDAGSREVLHKVGAHRACAAAITLDSPGANYRTVWALSKYFPNVKTFVRAHDVDHGINLEKAGATAVVPETLEPSLQLASAVLAQAKLPMSEIAATINEFRSRHLSELTELSETSGSSLGYGFSRIMSKPKSSADSSSDDNQISDGALAI